MEGVLTQRRLRFVSKGETLTFYDYGFVLGDLGQDLLLDLFLLLNEGHLHPCRVEFLSI